MGCTGGLRVLTQEKKVAGFCGQELIFLPHPSWFGLGSRVGLARVSIKGSFPDFSFAGTATFFEMMGRTNRWWRLKKRR